MKIFFPLRLLAAALTAISMGVAHAQTTAVSSVPATNSKLGVTTKKEARQENHLLVKNVRHSLYRTKGLDASDITVFARNGAVTLVGTAADQGQIDLAGRRAAGVSGVVSVKNQLVRHVNG